MIEEMQHDITNSPTPQWIVTLLAWDGKWLIFLFFISFHHLYLQHHNNLTCVFRVRLRIWHNYVLITNYFDYFPLNWLVTGRDHMIKPEFNFLLFFMICIQKSRFMITLVFKVQKSLYNNQIANAYQNIITYSFIIFCYKLYI